MSGVLDRMAQRALGLLPAVQPLVAPRYAGPRAEPQALPMPEMTAGLERVAEIEAIAHVRPQAPVARKAHVAEEGPLAQRQEEEKPEKSLEVRRLVSRPGAPEKISYPQQPPQRAAQPAVERSREVEAEVRPAQALTHAPTNAPTHVQARTQAGNRSETAQMPKAVPNLRPAEPRHEIAKTEANREERKTSEAMSAPLPKDEPSRHEPVRSPEFPKSSRAVIAPPPLLAGRRAMLQAERQAAEEKSEVHISIGSIELRAPRPEPRPPAAPFRPRVSLDDFLRRGQETRS